MHRLAELHKVLIHFMLFLSHQDTSSHSSHGFTYSAISPQNQKMAWHTTGRDGYRPH